MALSTRLGCPDCGLPAEVSTVVTLLPEGSATATVHADCACGPRDVMLVEMEWMRRPSSSSSPTTSLVDMEQPKPRKKAAKKAVAKSAAKPSKKTPAKKASKK